jgi:LPS export ABC transporter protein LptC
MFSGRIPQTLFIVLATVGLFALYQYNQTRSSEQPVIQPDTDMAWIAKNTTIWQINAENIYILTSPQAQHNQATEQTDFTQPNAWIWQNEKITQIRAEHGILIQQQDLILKQNVLLNQFATNSEANTPPDTTISTERLHYQIPQALIVTDEVVKIQSQQSRQSEPSKPMQTQGTGMSIDLNAKTLELHANVRTTLQP